MALDSSNRLAIRRTIGDAIRTTWALRLPYLVIVFSLGLPWAILAALGVFDPLGTYVQPGADGQLGSHDILATYPYGTLLVSWAYGFLVMVVFGILWHRHVLLGRQVALKLSLGALNAVFWRSCGYGFAAFAVALVGSFVAVFLAGLLNVLVIAFFTTAEFWLGVIVTVCLMFVLFLGPMAVLARISLAFPAIAVEQRLGFRQSWSRTKGATWRMVGALLGVGLPSTLIVYASYFGLLYGLFDFNLLDPTHSIAMSDYWWLSFALGPWLYLPMALAFSVVALVFRDFAGPAAATSSD